MDVFRYGSHTFALEYIERSVLPRIRAKTYYGKGGQRRRLERPGAR